MFKEPTPGSSLTDELIQLGNNLPTLSDEEKTPDRLLSGCSYNIWLDAEKIDGRYYFKLDASSKIGRGIISLIYEGINGKTEEEIKAFDFEALHKKYDPIVMTKSRANPISTLEKYILMNVAHLAGNAEEVQKINERFSK